MMQNLKNKGFSVFVLNIKQLLRGIDLRILRNTLIFFWFMETHDPSWYVPCISHRQNIG